MSDPMQTVMQNKSIFNPVDSSMMAQGGEITPDMTVREYFAKLGVDVEGPISQLVDMAKDQMQKGNPINKMKSIAGGPTSGMKPGMGQPPQMPQGRVPEAPGMEGLLKR